ncbi:MAG: ABC transporter substrate-binding protein, partial [Rhodoferax sp.]
MPKNKRWPHAVALVLACVLPTVGWTQGTKAEVIHWWTSGGESAAVKSLAEAYRAAGGVWVDTAVALGEQARSVAINRIVGGNPSTAAQFNTSRQFLDLVEQGMLNPIDEVAVRDGWDKFLPETVINVVKVKGHYYAAPVNIHMPAWIWTSKAAFKQAGIASEPKTMDELFAALDKLRAAGLVPLAHGGQSWQDNIVFTAVLINVGGRELYLKVLRDRDANAIQSDAFKSVLLTFKRLQTYVDKGSPGRNWNDATAMLITGKAGVQFMGDWAKGEFTLANKEAGRDYGCIAGFGANSPYIIQGDVLVFPRTSNPEQIKAQKLLASVVTAPATQVAFSAKKGSIPIRTDVDASKMDLCAQQGIAIMKDKSRQLGNGEVYLSPDQN